MNNMPRFVVLVCIPEYENMSERYSLVASTNSLHYLNIIAGAVKKSNKKSKVYWADTTSRHGVWEVVWKDRKIDFEKQEDSSFCIAIREERGKPFKIELVRND